MRHRQEISSGIAIQGHSEITDISRIRSETRRLVRIGCCGTAHERRCRTLLRISQANRASDVGHIIVQLDGNTDGRRLRGAAVIVIERKGQRAR